MTWLYKCIILLVISGPTFSSTIVSLTSDREDLARLHVNSSLEYHADNVDKEDTTVKSGRINGEEFDKKQNEGVKSVRCENTEEVSKCTISVSSTSAQYFQGQLLQHQPHFVQFRLKFQNTNFKNTKDVFQGDKWFWTYNTSVGPYPFISWNLDYGLLSFGLLDARTIHIPYVDLIATSACNITLGSVDTSLLITNALRSLVIPAKESEIVEFIQYRESYFCYLVADLGLRGTMRYFAAQYLVYPCSYILYKCCTVAYNYSYKNYDYSCQEGNIPGVQSWFQTSHLPASLVILIIAFCPIPLFQYSAWVSKRDLAIANNYVGSIENGVEDFRQIEDEDNWVYADGKRSPLTFYDLFSFEMLGMYDTYPILTSRLRRLIHILLAPVIIIIKVAWYNIGLGMWSDKEKITMSALIKAGTPTGFHSILADPWNEYKTFVPGLGGALSISVIYYVLGILFIVFPRCVKQVVEDGLPRTNLYITSPLFFGYNEILKMSKVNVGQEQLETGYLKGASLMKCNFYLLFTKEFWIRVWRIQSRRIPGRRGHTHVCLSVLWLFIFPFYVTFCIVEIIACLLYYGLPFCFFVVVMVKGAVKSLRYLRDQRRILSVIFSNKLFIALGVLTVFIMFSLFAYIVSLAAFVSFWFIIHVFAMCFIAVIIYPSASFGYLFFLVIVLYYFIKQIRHFNDGYEKLLSTAVDISKNMTEEEPFRVAITDGYISVTNIKCEHIKGIKINGTALDDKANGVFLNHNQKIISKIRKKNHVFGIPKGLFDHLVQKHRPVHKQFLSLLFRVSIMVVFVIVTFSITSNHTSGSKTDISEVMHVIFIVVVGVVPQLIGIAFANSNSALVREIEERKIEESIKEFWST